MTCIDSEHRRLRGIRAAFDADIIRYLNKSPENQAAGDNWKSRLGAVLTPQLTCLFVYRLAHFFFANGHKRTARLLSRLNFLLHKTTIPAQACIGPGCFIPHPAGVTFCGTAGESLTLYSLAVCCAMAAHPDAVGAPVPRLGNRVTIGGRAVLLGGITVGDDTKVFAVRLDQDAPAGSIVIANARRQRIRATAHCEV
jgi:serine O-acetyltransferase